MTCTSVLQRRSTQRPVNRLGRNTGGQYQNRAAGSKRVSAPVSQPHRRNAIAVWSLWAVSASSTYEADDNVLADTALFLHQIFGEGADMILFNQTVYYFCSSMIFSTANKPKNVKASIWHRDDQANASNSSLVEAVVNESKKREQYALVKT